MDSDLLIGNINLPFPHFELEDLFSEFQQKDFKNQSSRQRFRLVNEKLLRLIQDTPSPTFLLTAVLHYIDQVNKAKILKDPYHFTLFEFWLNSYAGLKPEEKYKIRAKIGGQFFPREDYQVFFPIGMGNYFSGTHFVVAHLSPDIDTTIASFWGWLDAFSAQVSEGLHLWSLPGGPPDSPITQLFKDNFGPSFFSNLARQSSTLTLNALDLVNTKNVIRAIGKTPANTLIHGFEEKAVLLVDENGHYLGDWRSSDVEPVRAILILFNLCLSWFETLIHTRLISLFTRQTLNASEIQPFIFTLFNLTFEECEPLREYMDQQQDHFEDFLIQILGVSKGWRGTFYDMIESLKFKEITELHSFFGQIMNLASSEIFDGHGLLIENRPNLFMTLQKLITDLDNATHTLRSYLERLDIALQIKHLVLKKTLHYLTIRSDVEDIRIKLANYSYLTVVLQEEDGLLYPIGVIWAQDLRKTSLGTVSLRDFCNPDEMKMASYLSIISVIDHHKTSLKTNTPPLVIIADAQSCNVLVAELGMGLNDTYSTAGMSLEEINQQINSLNSVPSSNQARLLQSLLKRRIAAESTENFYIHPFREFTEYLYFIHAILDDTDLLTKVSARDVHCVVQLLNRMKTIVAKKEVEVMTLDDLPKNKDFPILAAKKILKNSDMYSIYKKIYSLKEKDVSKNIKLCAQGLPSNIFLDTKEQNGCCRVGQTKLFRSNFDLFWEYRESLQNVWLKIAQNICSLKPEIDFHLQMISTIISADDIFNETSAGFSHYDEFWFWLPDTEQASHHLAFFLSSLQGATEVKQQKMELEIRGKNISAMNFVKDIFQRNLAVVLKEKTKLIVADNELIVLKFNAGSLNSRKSMVSPYLPKLIS